MTRPAGRPALSVVVMGYRDASTICGAVSSVVAQDCSDSIEVIVVTSGDARSAESVRRSFPGLCVIESADRLLPGAARNAGLRAARGDFVAFLAADCRATRGWAAARLAAHRAGYAAVAAAVLPGERATAVEWAGHYLLFASRLPGAASEEIVYPDARVHGLSYARALLERVGPFREDLRIGEDTEMARRLRDHGVRMWFAANAAIAHKGERGLRGLLRDQYMRGMRKARFLGPPPPRRWSRTRALLGAGRDVWHRLRWAQQRVSAHAPHHRRNFARVTPWMIAGALAQQAGWAYARVRVIEAAGRRDSRGGGATSSVRPEVGRAVGADGMELAGLEPATSSARCGADAWAPGAPLTLPSRPRCGPPGE